LNIEYRISELIKAGDAATLAKAAAERPELFDDGHWFPAIKAGELNVCKTLVRAGLSPQWTRFPRAPLHFAAYGRELDIGRGLLEVGADPNARDSEGNKPLDLVYAFGDGKPPADIVDALVLAGTDVGLWTSVRMGDLDRCKALLERSPHLLDGLSSCLGFTPLMIAARHNRCEIARFLIASGADVNALSSELKNGDGGNPPVWFAAQGVKKGRETMVELLLSHSANPNLAGEGGWAGLHMAAQWNHPDVARILLEHGADIALLDNDDSTALDIAKKHGSEPVIDFLITLS
jgi:ankyrin repeat protein